jgi:hypothetical protein
VKALVIWRHIESHHKLLERRAPKILGVGREASSWSMTKYSYIAVTASASVPWTSGRSVLECSQENETQQLAGSDAEWELEYTVSPSGHNRPRLVVR